MNNIIYCEKINFDTCSTAQVYIDEVLAEIKNAKNEEDIPESLFYELVSTPDLSTDQAIRTIVDVFVAGIDSVCPMFYIVTSGKCIWHRYQPGVCDTTLISARIR